ncbi:hypothetical protein AGDE_04580 [Angomonas deanei]|uniref:Uncharacterized protein n=1 Tax=Angomonas deanei TaxID=59799 RepID=S9U3T5_9TRYP|nr:hypothetical protein AGDE_11740 [Angomonas deanei]EPY39348.1 hypothetical protein AGDE_04580 [Angomonas deanei]CAD2219128.1 hypothetical protein, conserved [Angomonas deanei]|eukprot:EPY25467.1 hypothetical protein AGDE_11740 [Angomonas deanei]
MRPYRTPIRRLSGLRSFTRGIPYSPVGTIQDFSSSPRHTRLAELQRDLDTQAGRAPTGLFNGPTISTREGMKPLIPPERLYSFRASEGTRPKASDFAMPKESQSFQQDMRVDPAYDDVPEHVRAAKQSMLMMQSDSYGESIRGVVPPPPPIGEVPDPRPYTQPKVQLDDVWWILMGAIFALFAILVKFGK